MSAKKFKVGDLVWAGMKYYPFWPGKIIEAPKSMKMGKQSHCVYFFGADNHASIADSRIFPYEKYKAKYAAQKTKMKDFEKALRDIENYIASDARTSAKKSDPKPKPKSVPKRKPKEVKVAKKAAKVETKKTQDDAESERSTPRKSSHQLETPATNVRRKLTFKHANAASQIGIIGLGTVGSKLARFLLRQNFSVTAWNRRVKKYKAFAGCGLKIAPSISALMRKCDIVLCCVATREAVKELTFLGHGIIHGLGRDGARCTGLILLSTVDPITSMEIAEAIMDRGGRYLEAPMFNTSFGFEEKDPIFVASGSESLNRDASPILQGFGKHVLYLGREVGAAQKLCNVATMFLGTLRTALAEGLVLARNCQISISDLLRFMEVVPFGCEGVKRLVRHLASERQPEKELRALRLLQQGVSLGVELSHRVSVPVGVSNQASVWMRHAAQCRMNNHDLCNTLRGNKR